MDADHKQSVNGKQDVADVDLAVVVARIVLIPVDVVGRVEGVPDEVQNEVVYGQTCAVRVAYRLRS